MALKPSWQRGYKIVETLWKSLELDSESLIGKTNKETNNQKMVKILDFL